MDVLPTKFRSPPPKPPRRRHSDQLSISQSGTFPINRNKCFDESKNCDNREFENSISSCDSLPSNWTPDCSSEEKFEHAPNFSEKSGSINHIKNVTVTENVLFHKHKSCEKKNIIHEFENNSNGLTKSKPPYIHQIMKNDVFNNSECKSKNLFENSNIDLSNVSVEEFLKANNPEHFSMKSIFKDHKRHNSDPLPVDLIAKDLNPLFQLSSDIRNKLTNPDYSSNKKESYCLLVELKSMKEINNKLWEHLCCLQASLDNLKKNSNGGCNQLSVSDVLSSLYDSLKAKENAMEDRMKVISEERDNAMQDLDSMVQIVAGSFEDSYYSAENSSDKEIKELLKQIEDTCSPVKLLQQQRLLLSHLYRSKELKQDHMLHELKLITSERDNLKEKVKALEEELSQLKLSNDIWNTDNKFWESNLLNTLCQVIHQRDVAVKNYNTQNMDYFGSRSSFSEKPFNADTISNCLQRFDESSVKKNILQSSQNDMSKFAPFSLKSNKPDEIRYLKEEILVLNKSLEIEMQRREKAEEKCIRLERRINVLQKKICGQNVGVPV